MTTSLYEKFHYTDYCCLLISLLCSFSNSLVPLIDRTLFLRTNHVSCYFRGKFLVMTMI